MYSLDEAQYLSISRALLTTLAQTQATIIAIIDSLAILAVQLSSQMYTPKVIDFVLRSKSFWLMIVIFGLSIVFDFTALNLVNSFIFLPIINVVIPLPYAGIFLMMVAYSFLIYFTSQIIRDLKPEVMISNLIESVNPTTLVRYLIKEEGIEKDPLVPVKDVITKVIESGDESTAIRGILKFSELFRRIISKEGIDSLLSEGYEDYIKKFEFENYSIEEYKKDNLGKIATYFLSHITSFVNTAIEKRLNSTLEASVMTIGDIAKITAKRGLTNETIYACKLLEQIGIKSVKIEVGDTVNLEEIVEEYLGIPRYSPSLWLIIDTLTSIGNIVAKNLPEEIGLRRDHEAEENYWKKGGDILSEVTKSLGVLGKIAVERELEIEAEKVIRSIVSFGYTTINKAPGIVSIYAPEVYLNPIYPIIQYLTLIFTSSRNWLCYDLTYEYVKELGEIGKMMTKNGISPNFVISKMREIWEFHKEKEYYGVASGIFDSLISIANALVESSSLSNFIKDSIKDVVILLKDIAIRGLDMPQYGDWKIIVYDTPKYILMFCTRLILNGNEQLGENLIKILKELEIAYNSNLEMQGYIGKVIEDMKSKKSFELMRFQKRIMTEEEIHAFEKVLALYNQI
jgi:hypothetical protein